MKPEMTKKVADQIDNEIFPTSRLRLIDRLIRETNDGKIDWSAEESETLCLDMSRVAYRKNFALPQSWYATGKDGKTFFAIGKAKAKNAVSIVFVEFDCNQKAVFATSTMTDRYFNKSDKLFRLYQSAKKSWDTFVDEMIAASRQRSLKPEVTVKELFRAVKNTEQLARDFADEKTYRLMKSGYFSSEDEILESIRFYVKEARKTIKRIENATEKESGERLKIIENEHSPLYGMIEEVVTPPEKTAPYLTDLHVRICPGYYDDGDPLIEEFRDNAVKTAALLILLALIA